MSFVCVLLCLCPPSFFYKGLPLMMLCHKQRQIFSTRKSEWNSWNSLFIFFLYHFFSLSIVMNFSHSVISNNERKMKYISLFSDARFRCTSKACNFYKLKLSPPSDRSLPQKIRLRNLKKYVRICAVFACSAIVAESYNLAKQPAFYIKNNPKKPLNLLFNHISGDPIQYKPNTRK